MSSLLGACLLAALPAQALALPATFTNTAADTQASWAPTITPSNMCKGSSYAEATGNSAALTADCQALRDAVYSNNGVSLMFSPIPFGFLSLLAYCASPKKTDRLLLLLT